MEVLKRQEQTIEFQKAMYNLERLIKSFEETEHPRDAQGKFTSKGEDSSAKNKYESDVAQVKKDLSLLAGVLETGKSASVYNKQLGEIIIDEGKTGKSGYGLKHIIEQRYKKDGKNLDEISAILYEILDTTKTGSVCLQSLARDNTGKLSKRYEIKKEVIAYVSSQRFGKDEYFLLTGFASWEKEKEATDAIKTVIANYSYTPEFSAIRKQVGAVIASLSTLLPKKTKKSRSKNIEVHLKNITEENKKEKLKTLTIALARELNLPLRLNTIDLSDFRLEKAYKYIRRWKKGDKWQYEYPKKTATLNRKIEKINIAKKTKLIDYVKPLEPTGTNIKKEFSKLKKMSQSGNLKVKAYGNFPVMINKKSTKHLYETRGKKRDDFIVKERARLLPFIPEILNKTGRLGEVSRRKGMVTFGVLGRVKVDDKIKTIEIALGFDNNKKLFFLSAYEVKISASLNEYHRENSLTQPDADKTTMHKNMVGSVSSSDITTDRITNMTTYTNNNIIDETQENVKSYKDIVLKINNISEMNKQDKFFKAIETTAKALNIPFGFRKEKIKHKEPYKHPIQKEISESWGNLYAIILAEIYSELTEILDLPAINAETVKKAFIESEHPRDNTGKFTSKGEGSSVSKKTKTTRERVKKLLDAHAEPMPEIEFTRENYNKLFPLGLTDTPLGTVKMGEHQFEKLQALHRETLLGAVKETLQNPLVIIKETKNGKNSLLYVKSFEGEKRQKIVQSVVVTIDNTNVSISTHEKDKNNVLNKIKNADQVVYMNKKVGDLAKHMQKSFAEMVSPTAAQLQLTVTEVSHEVIKKSSLQQVSTHERNINNFVNKVKQKEQIVYSKNAEQGKENFPSGRQDGGSVGKAFPTISLSDNWAKKSSPKIISKSLFSNLGIKIKRLVKKLFGNFKLKSSGKILYDPETGKPFKRKDFDRLINAIEDVLNEGTNGVGKQMTVDSVASTKLLKRLEKLLEKKELDKVNTSNLKYKGRTFDYLRKDYRNLTDTTGEPLSRAEKMRYQVCEDTATQYITRTNDEIKANIKQVLLDGIIGRKDKREVSQDLYNKFGELNRSWKRIADTETVNTSNLAFVLDETAGAERGEKIYFKRYEMGDACPICKKFDGVIALWSPVPLSNDKIKDEYAEVAIWDGKKADGKTLVVGAIHPHCRGGWVRWEPPKNKS